MRLRKLSELGFPVGSNVIAAVGAIEASGGRHTHDSGHAVGPTWIYTFPTQHDAQVALRINREKLSVYLSANPHGRANFESLVPRFGQVEQVYPNPDEKPANSLLSEDHAPFLTPKRGRLLRLAVDNTKFEPMLQAYLYGAPAAGAVDPVDGMVASGVAPTATVSAADESTGSSRAAPPISPEALRRQLDQNDATGRAGERLVYVDEIARLTALGCPNPAAHVHLIADTDAAAGYDIHSEWNGELRCIEVKTTSAGRSDIYLSENERCVLERLGARAWLYRVDLSGEVGGAVVLRLQDPVAKLGRDRFVTVVWQLDLGKSLAWLGDTD